MALVTRTQNVDLDAWFSNPGGNYGNGKGPRLQVGYADFSGTNGQNRVGLHIPLATIFAGITSAAAITAASVKLRARGTSGCFSQGGTPKVWLEEATAAITENAETVECLVSGAGVATARWPGPGVVTTHRVKYEGDPAAGAWITIPILAMIQAAKTAGKTEITLRLAAADAATGYDESNTARRLAFYSRHTSSIPYLELTFSDEQAPLIPTDLFPPEGSKVASTPGTSATISGRHTHPEGKPSTKYEAAWYPAGATDAVPGTPTKADVVTATTNSGVTRSHTFTGLPARTAGKWRMRFERAGLWGPWSLMLGATTAYQPAVPTSPSVTPSTLTPDYFASLVSGDAGDFITAGEVNVYQDPAAGQTITKWASGKVTIGGSPTRLQLAYGGTSLTFGQQYRWRVRLWNRDDVPTEFTGDLYFTPSEQIGPTITPGDTSTKQNTKTPTFVLANPAGGNIDQYRMRFYSPAGTLLSDTGVVGITSAASANVVTPTGLWDWGQEPLVDAAIRPTGNPTIGPFSDQRRVHLNTAPGAPYPPSIEHATAQVVQRPDGVWIIDANNPIFRMPFRDLDKDLGYVESAVRREIEVRDLADAHFSASPYISTTTPLAEAVAPTSTLVAETTYKFRGRWDDTANVRSAWSDYIFVRRSARPSLSNVTPAAAATITDPTPPIAWTFFSNGGKLQASYRVTASVAGSQIYDSGWVAGTASSHPIPPGILPNATAVDWTLEITDTDGLLNSSPIARTFTTNFTTPPVLTGLTATPDTDAKAILVAWTASTIPAAEFLAYRVYARTAEGQFRLVATIADQATVSYLYRGAGHNVEEIVRVAQYNGWAESAPAEVSAILESEGYWRLAADGAPVELRWARGGLSGAAQTEAARYAPLAFEPDVTIPERVVTIATRGYAWRLALWIPPDDAAVLRLLEEDKRLGRIVLVKTPRGRALYSKITAVPVTEAEAGYTESALEGVEVGADAAGF